MGLWHFGATALDRWVAKTVARYTSPAVERPARVLTWAADEHVLGVIAGGLWLAARAGNERERRQTDHLVLSVVVTAILPHVLKRLIDQKRPDRCMVHGARRGIPRSGKPYDAFPSGHAMHVGAVASAVSWAYPKSAPVAWGLGGLIAATRIVILAHWTTDVLAGLAMGALLLNLSQVVRAASFNCGTLKGAACSTCSATATRSSFAGLTASAGITKTSARRSASSCGAASSSAP
jgi:membrane-associated phospholipid phosphatase